MHPNFNSAPTNNGAKQCSFSASIRRYTPPVERESGGCRYVEFYAYDPEKGKLRRKRIKTNRVKGAKNYRTYVRDLIHRIGEQLYQGWNPWIDNRGDYVFIE